MGKISKILLNDKAIGWFASILLIVGMYFVGNKSILAFVFGTVGNGLWIYVGLKRDKQFDLAFVALVMTILNIRALIIWIN